MLSSDVCRFRCRKLVLLFGKHCPLCFFLLRHNPNFYHIDLLDDRSVDQVAICHLQEARSKTYDFESKLVTCVRYTHGDGNDIRIGSNISNALVLLVSIITNVFCPVRARSTVWSRCWSSGSSSSSTVATKFASLAVLFAIRANVRWWAYGEGLREVGGSRIWGYEDVCKIPAGSTTQCACNAVFLPLYEKTVVNC